MRATARAPRKPAGAAAIKSPEPPNPVLQTCGPIHIVPYGPSLTLARSKLLEARIKRMGGHVAASPKNAKIVVVDPGLRSEELLKQHVLAPRYSSALKLSLPWLEAVLDGDEKDPSSESIKETYAWVDPNRLSGSMKSEDFQHSDHEDDDDKIRRLSLDTDAASDMGPLTPRGNDPVHQLNMNQVLIDELSKMADMCAARGDKWRAKSYAQAAVVIKTLDFQVQSSDDLIHRKGIGKGMAAHIDEILNTGRYQKRMDLEKDPRTNSVVELTKIFGIGKTQAGRLFNLGFRTPEDVQTAMHMNDERLSWLNRNQRIGVELFEELNQRIRREEIDQIVESIKRNLAVAYPAHLADKITVEATGSYRRGKKDCGDCDILMTCPSYPQHRVALRPLLKTLMKPASGENYGLVITHSLMGEDDWVSQSTEDAPYDIRRRKAKREVLDSDDGVLVTNLDEEKQVEPESFMGICQLIQGGEDGTLGIHHRIDIKSYPFECYPFALMYFTGSALFSRNMRHIAHGKGFTLTDRGLYPYVPTMESLAAKSRLNCVPCRSERDVFEALQLEYKEPKDRNYDEVVDLVNESEEDYGAHERSTADTASLSIKREHDRYAVKSETDDYYRKTLYGSETPPSSSQDSPTTDTVDSNRKRLKTDRA